MIHNVDMVAINRFFDQESFRKFCLNHRQVIDGGVSTFHVEQVCDDYQVFQGPEQIDFEYKLSIARYREKVNETHLGTR